MKGILKYNILIAGVAIIATSCNNEENLKQFPTEGNSLIRISSGQIGYSTRDVKDEPTFPGQCNADKLIVYQYDYHNYGFLETNKADPTKMKYLERYETEVDHFSDNEPPYFQSDKWARQSAIINYPTTNTSAFAFPALAYSKADEENFNVNYEGSLDEMYLKLTGKITPELYFGRVTMEMKEDNYHSYDATTGIYRAYETSKKENVSIPLEGTLYRIVSQINVTITNVNSDLVEKMTMELSNIPTKVSLYANHRTELGKEGTDHGYHYPIVAAKEDQQTEETTVVCETSDFRNGVAKLSTFLLPSETGRTLNIHLYFKDGSNLTYKDKSYEVKPPKSYYIPKEFADAYFSEEPLCIYSDSQNLFFSYSNVRVNLTGEFDNFFPEKTEVNMNVEICPGFVKEHNYDEMEKGGIDYNKK